MSGRPEQGNPSGENLEKFLTDNVAVIVAVLVVLIVLLILLGCTCLGAQKRRFGRWLADEPFDPRANLIGCGSGYAIGGKTLCMQQDDSSYDISSLQERSMDALDNKMRAGEAYMVAPAGKFFPRNSFTSARAEGFSAKNLSASIAAQGGNVSADWYTLDGEKALPGKPSGYDQDPTAWMPVAVDVARDMPDGTQSVARAWVLSPVRASAFGSAANGGTIRKALQTQQLQEVQKVLGCPDLSNRDVQREYAQRENAWSWQVAQARGGGNSQNTATFLDPRAANGKFQAETFLTDATLQNSGKLYAGKI